MPKNITINPRKLAERKIAKPQAHHAIVIKPSDTVKRKVSEIERRRCDARRKAEWLRGELEFKRVYGA